MYIVMYMTANVTQAFADLGFVGDRAVALAQLLWFFGLVEPSTKGKHAPSADVELLFKNLKFSNQMAVIDWLNDVCQANFLRRTPERQQLIDSNWLASKREEIIPLLGALGFVDEVVSKQPYYDVLLFLGSVQGDITSRLEYLEKLLKHGVRFGEVYLLGGKRDLWIDREPLTFELLAERFGNGKSINENLKYINDRVYDIYEGYFAQGDPLIYDKRKKVIEYFTSLGLSWPNESELLVKMFTNRQKHKLAGIKFTLVDTPANIEQNRPNTIDTIYKFYEGYGKSLLAEGKSKVLALTNQPNIQYQNQAVNYVLKSCGFAVETVGKSINRERNKITEILDALARTIFLARKCILKEKF
jgi:hypothetical protein